MTNRRLFLLFVAALSMTGCASMPHSDPLQVTVAGVDGLPGEGMEMRMLVKLRVQNPNETPIEFTGVYVQLDVMEKTFATGVSDESGVVPAFGETVVAVPVTVSALRAVRQVVGMLDGQPVDQVRYQMSGKLNGGLFNTHRFESKGAFALPEQVSVAAD
ncbi:MAG: LEA type 2 family protein [Steroidobacteraceae bacterium]|nr:LEA type 2 family protein [Steroidobacteraceae bacterium]